MRLLIDIGNLQALLHDQQTIVQFGNARDDFQQGRLAGAVATDQTDTFACFEGKLRVIEKRNVSECELRIGERNDCHKYAEGLNRVPGRSCFAATELRRKTALYRLCAGFVNLTSICQRSSCRNTASQQR